MMEKHDNINSPASPQEWYEAGVLLRKQERFGDAVNAFRAAADLAAAAISSATGAPETPEIENLRKIRAASEAFIDLIDEIRAFVNTDLMNP